MIRQALVLLAALAFALGGKASEPIAVPSGFRLQVLDPTDGRIAMPEGWFYTSSGTSSGWMWIFSKEDPALGPYETGFRVQLLAGIREGAHKSPQEFAQEFLNQKKQSTRVVSECPAQEQGEFMRQCLEVIEQLPLKGAPRPYHISYSAFWGKETDMVIITTFGTLEGQWKDFAHASDVMSHVQVIGPSFGK